MNCVEAMLKRDGNADTEWTVISRSPLQLVKYLCMNKQLSSLADKRLFNQTAEEVIAFRKANINVLQLARPTPHNRHPLDPHHRCLPYRQSHHLYNPCSHTHSRRFPKKKSVILKMPKCVPSTLSMGTLIVSFSEFDVYAFAAFCLFQQSSNVDPIIILNLSR